jgi:hypothetical protein
MSVPARRLAQPGMPPRIDPPIAAIGHPEIELNRQESFYTRHANPARGAP